MEAQTLPTSVKMEDISPRSSVQAPTFAPEDSAQHARTGTAEESLAQIERKFQSAVCTLEELGAPLGAAKDDSQANLFLGWAQDLLHKAPRPQTIIGVVGSTGSGKSSVINAVLDEEYIVPTSCVRACTAAVTEISWNYSDDPDELYRAEIEFLTVEEWDRELELFYGSLADCSDDFSGGPSNDDKDAGVAWEKMIAVYPQYTKQGLIDASARELANLPEIRNITGTIKRIADSSCKSLHDQLLKYIDSKEKSTAASKAARSKVRSEQEDRDEELADKMEFWPMIKVVRVFTKSDALSTGAIMVDLPGVQDSNAARAAIADKYLQKCSNIWIVAPLTRAVDDKTAQNLLGRAFRTQLRYDGAESKITFICSKSDDFSVKEAIKSLGLKKAIEDYNGELEKLDTQRTEAIAKRGDLQRQIKDGTFARNEILRNIREYTARSAQLTDGRVVYTPNNTPRKRKSKQPRPSRRRSSYISDSSDSSTTGTATDESGAEDGLLGEPLTKERIQEELDRLQTAMAENSESDKCITKEIKEVRKHEKALNKEKKWADARLKFACMQVRNNYAREALQYHYACGIREMDNEAALQENEELAVPEKTPRDYDEVAKSLDVFCVSSWHYQAAPDRIAADKIPPGFDALKETEVPQLQNHTQKLTEENRKRHCRKFMAEFLPIRQTLETWSHEKIITVELAEGEKKAEADWIDDNLASVKQELDRGVVQLMSSCRTRMDQHLFSKATSLVQRASTTAADTAHTWGEKDSQGQFLRWVTYKAICRRGGYFTNYKGRNDFNQDLAQPLLDDMRGSWEQVFRREIPDAVEKLPPIAEKVIRDFDSEVRGRVKAHPRLSSIELDGVALEYHIAVFQNTVDAFGKSIAKIQRKNNREFVRSIAASMHGAYTACTNESGRGSFARMKTAMHQHVLSCQGQMFMRPLAAVRSTLNNKCDTKEKKILLQIDKLVHGMRTEYYQAIIGRNLSEISKKARAEVSKILAGFDNRLGQSHEALQASL